MSRGWQAALFVTVAAVALAAGFLLQPSAPRQGGTRPPATAATALMEATLPDLEGRPQSLSQWRGRVVVVNFWATWCAPCREEIPALIAIQNELGPKGVQIVGIAVDQADRVGPYAAEIGVNYPVLIGELAALELAQRAGNPMGGLPFTVVLDRSGTPVRSELGELDRSKLEAILAPLL